MRHWRTVPVAGEPRLTAAQRERRLIAAGILGTSALVLAQVAAQLVNYRFYDLRLHALNSNGDGGVFGVVGAVALFAASAIAWAALPRLPEARRPLRALAPLLTFLAVDKVLRLHDDVPHWLVLYLPVLAATFLLLLEVARRVGHRARRLIMAALILLAAAFVVHQYGDHALARLHESPTGWLYQLKGVTKHGAELAGWLFVGLGIMAGCITTERKPASSPAPESSDQANCTTGLLNRLR